MPKALMAAFIALAGATSAHALSLTSPDFKSGARLAIEQVYNQNGCAGSNLSPALAWSGAPKGTKSFALLVEDSDAPVAGGFWHWAIYDISADATGLRKAAGGAAAPSGASQAANDFGSPGYGGPCPPAGDAAHHYHFELFALDVARLGVAPGSSIAAVRARLNGHALAKAELVGVWGR